MTRSQEKAASHWAQPTAVTDVDIAFPAGVSHLMPAWTDLPEDFQNDRSPWCAPVNKWFFSGLKKSEFKPKDCIDEAMAWRHLKCIMGSFEPKHEHKTAAVAWLMSQWFDRAGGAT